jgi:CRP/FNR family cyclic AMP-dependent transcriptional regulator
MLWDALPTCLRPTPSVRSKDRATTCLYGVLWMKTKLLYTGLKQVLLPPVKDQGALDTATVQAHVLFGPPPEPAASERGSDLVDFLKQVLLFEELSRSDLRQLARIVHERSYHDGEIIYEQGKPGVALFAIRRGVVELIRRRPNGDEQPLLLLEPPASLEELAVTGAEVLRWTSARARGPVSLVALGCSDLDALGRSVPLLANKILKKLVQITAMRLQMLVEPEFFKEDDKGVLP